MKPISEIHLTLTCRVCGKVNTFTGNQYSKTCTCGTMLIKQRGLSTVNSDRQPTCFLCHDEGLVFYQVQEGDSLYHYVAKCRCSTGQARDEDYPGVEQVDNIADLRWLEVKNRGKWEKEHGREAEPTLIKESEIIEVDAGAIPF